VEQNRNVDKSNIYEDFAHTKFMQSNTIQKIKRFKDVNGNAGSHHLPRCTSEMV